MNLFHKIAAVLETAADHIDAQTKTAAQVAPVETAPTVETKTAAKGVDHLAEVYEAVTGKTPDPEVLDKLASDQQMRDVFLKIAEHAAGAESLGGPAERDDQPTEPKTAAERNQRADDRFRDWILNG